MAPHHQPQVPEFLFGNSPLQNGEHQKPEGCGPTRTLHGEVGPTRRISDSPNASINMQVSLFLLERGGIRNPIAPVWPSPSPAPLYKAPQALVGFFPGKRNTDHNLPRRYADPGRGVTVRSPHILYLTFCGSMSLSPLLFFLYCFLFPRLLEEQLKGITGIIHSLCFLLNKKKCVTMPQRRIEFLDFVVDTVQMTLSLPPEKIAKMQKECRHAGN